MRAAIRYANKEDLSGRRDLIAMPIMLPGQDRSNSGMHFKLYSGSGAMPLGKLNSRPATGNQSCIDRNNRRGLHRQDSVQ